MWNYKKVIMLVLVVFGPLGLFYFLATGEYHFKKLPLLYDHNNGKPELYNTLDVTDQFGNKLDSTYFKDKIIVVNYMDKHCPIECKVDAKMMRLIVYKELAGAQGFNDVVMLTEVNDSVAANRKVMQDLLEVDGNKWKFVYVKNSSFFNFMLNGSNPFQTKTASYDNRKIKHVTMSAVRDVYTQLNLPMPVKVENYFTEVFYERCILIFDKKMRVRSFLDSSEDIEMKRVMEELRLLKKEYARKKNAI